jgi:SAM-dependent methyltransferase
MESLREVRAWVRERRWKQARRSAMDMLQWYVRGLILLIKRPRIAQELQAQEQRIKELESSLTRERREVQRLEQLTRRPPVGGVRFGDLRRLRPVSRNFGMGRGQPIDRYYIETFLASHADDVRGRVLEIHDNLYTKKYGGERVNLSDVLDIVEDNSHATIIADLTRADHVPSDAFDCIIFTQTLHLIYDMRSVVRTLHRILKPGGVLLATFPGISQISCRGCSDHWCWAFTQLSARLLFEEAFLANNIEVEAYGNVLAAVTLLHGIAAEELRQKELDHHDPDYEVLIALRAVKAETAP